MASDEIKISIRVGRSAGRFNAGDSRASSFFADEVAKEALGSTVDSNYVRLRDLEGRLTRSVNAELTNAVRYATDRMIGQLSPVGGTKTFHIEPSGQGVGLTSLGIGRPIRQPGFSGAHSVEWGPLSPRTRKAKSKNKNNFFLHTGSLKQVLRRNAASIAAATGGVKFEVLKGDRYRPIDRKTDFIRIARLRMTFLPRIHRGFLPGLHSGNVGSFDRTMRFEAMLGLPTNAWEKLRGPQRAGFARPEWHRPLLQPVFTYWTLFRLPNRVASVLDRILTTPTRGFGNYRGI